MAINAANVVLVQRVSVLCLRGFEYPRRIAYGCAALFACHPVHVEAVAGIVGRGDLLAHFFGLIAILVYTLNFEIFWFLLIIGKFYIAANSELRNLNLKFIH